MPPAVTPSREDWRDFLLALLVPCENLIPSSGQDLAVINGWDLTCDKAESMQMVHDLWQLRQLRSLVSCQVGRYLAPFAYAMASSSHGFGFAVLLSCCPSA